MKSLLNALRGRRLLVAGDAMLDHYIWGEATRISPEAPVPVVDVFRDTWAAGGAANVALNLVALGAHPTLAANLGRDEAGERLGAILAEHGVALAPGFPAGGASTILKTRVMVQGQQLCRIDREAPPEDYRLIGNAGWPEPDLFDEIDAVILSDYGKGAVTNALVAAVVAEASSRGKAVALDPKPWRALDFRGIDLITPNRNEALELAGLSSPALRSFPADEVVENISERYKVGAIVVTLGAEGMLVGLDGHVTARLPTVAREVFDVSGAGDTVIATLVAARAAGASLEDAARLANHAAGVVVGKVGTATASPSEILAFAERAGG